MDPLSIIANSIAVASIVTYGLEKLVELHEAKSDICSFINEVTDLKLILLEAERSVTECQSYAQQGQNSVKKISELLLPAKDKLEELEKIISGQLTSLSSSDSKFKSVRVRWLRHKSKVKKIILELKEVRVNLPVLWGAAHL
jgi:chromosome segregation ATPase